MDVDYEIAQTINALKNNNSIEFFARTPSYNEYEEKLKRLNQKSVESDPMNGLEIECIFMVNKKQDDPPPAPSLPPENEDEESEEPEIDILAQLTPKQCQYCFKTLSSKSKLNRHLKIHTEKRYFDCNVCLQVFRTQKIFDEHLKEHGENTVESILEPEIILSDHSEVDDEEVTTNDSVLEPEVVMGQHSEDDDEDQDFDEDSMPLPLVVKVNVSSSTGAAPESKLDLKRRYQCQLCPKAFRYSSKLARHQTVHTGEKPFQCDICQKCFTSKYSLKFHLQLHATKGKYICKICGKGFFNDHVLQRHQTVHSKSAKFKCHDCGRTYKWKNRYVEHRDNCRLKARLSNY